MHYVQVFFGMIMMVAAIDRIFGSKLGLGGQFERAFHLMGPLALSMIGMIVLTPIFSAWITPLQQKITGMLDPSFLPGIILANDLGGTYLCRDIANSELMGRFHGLIVTCTMGGTISFTLPLVVAVVKKHQQKDMFFGLLCGIATIPVGCLIGGLVMGVPFVALIVNLLPLIGVSGLIAVGILYAPNLCIKIFSVIGVIFQVMITVGLATAIFQELTGIVLIKNLGRISLTPDSSYAAVEVVMGAIMLMAGALPMMHMVSTIFERPVGALARKMNINSTSTVGLIACLTTSVTTYGLMEKMDRKGVVINAAFTVSAPFVFTDHLAWTMINDPQSVPAMIVAKLVAGVTSIVLACLLYKRYTRGNTAQESQAVVQLAPARIGEEVEQAAEGVEA